MGSEDLFHKRKAKKKADLAREKAKRKSYQRVLIVCEGEKTEPHYFNELKDFYELSTANVEVNGKCGSSPVNVFDKAKEMYSDERHSGNPFDKVFCVFDKDTHTTYEDTVKAINHIKPKGVFHHITSVPCFEFWLLLHYVSTTKPFVSKGKKSAADCVIKDLKKYIPDYEKGNSGKFEQLYDQLDFAKNNAARINQHAHENNTDNPSTMIPDLVSFLQKLKT